MTDNLDGGDLVALASVSAVALFTDEVKYTEFYQRVRAETVDNAPPADISTAKGRDVIKARAFKVTKAKMALAKTAKDLTEEWRTKTSLVNASRKRMVEELEALADEVRAPVTQWEDAEKARIARVDEVISNIRAASVVQPDESAAAVKERGLEVWESHLDEALFQDRLAEAEAAKQQTVATLLAAYQRLTQEEADRAELAALRAEREAREQRDAEEAAAKAQAELAEFLRTEEEKRRVAQEAADALRKADEEAAQARAIQKAKDDAAENARQEAERLADEKAAEAARIASEALAAEKKRADDLARQQQEQADKLAAAAAQAAAVAAEDAKRAKNRTHVSGVMSRAKEAIMRCGVTEEQARVIVLAIKAGEIPAVKMEF